MAFCVKLLTGPSLGVFKVIRWAKSKLLTGPRSFSQGFQAILFLLSYHCVCVCVFCSQFSGNFLKLAFFKQKKGAKIGFFNFLCFKFKF